MSFVAFQQLGVALALASLIGLERERRDQLDKHSSFGGVRTFGLIGLFGALSYMLFDVSAVFAVVTAGFLVLVVAAYIVTSKDNGDAGATTEIAAILVYLIGVLSAMSQYLVATGVTLAVLMMLHFKDVLHKWAAHLQNREIVSTIQFLTITFIILPLLPNRTIDPYHFFNPYLVWLMVVFISGISFLSYIAIKILGARKGIMASGFLAGFISSTALAFSFSAESKKNRGIVDPYVLAIVIASSAMFFRVLFEVFVLNKELFWPLLLPMSVMGLVGIAAAVFLFIKRPRAPNVVEESQLKLKSPFSFWPALKLGFFFGVVLFLTKFAATMMGNNGVYLASIFSGIFDVDAITVSMANLAQGDISNVTAVKAVTIAAMVNTFSKGAIFLLFGNKAVALRLIAVFGLIIGAGGLTVIFV